MRNLTTILRGLQDKPQLVTQSYANSVLEALENKDLSEFEKGSPELRIKAVDQSGNFKTSTKNRAALIEIEGGLTYKPRPCAGLSSYVQIEQAFGDLIAEGFTHIGFDMSSPGGQAYRCFASARRLRAMADEAGVKIISYVDGQAASAAYALVAISDEIVSNPMSSVGSIGAIVSISNDLPKELADGKERLFISDKDNKSPFSETGHLKDEVVSKIRTQVKELGHQFDLFVNEFRGISLEKIREMNAESFSAQEALEMGLIDKIMEREEFFDYLSQILTEDKQKQENVKLSDNVPTMADLEAVQALAAKQAEQLEALQAELTASKAEESKAVTVLEVLMAEKAKQAKEQLVSKLSGFSFIDDAEAVATVFEKLEDADKELFLASFQSAEDKIIDKKAEQEEETADLYEMKSKQADGDEGGFDATAEASKILKEKHNKGAK